MTSPATSIIWQHILNDNEAFEQACKVVNNGMRFDLKEWWAETFCDPTLPYPLNALIKNVLDEVDWGEIAYSLRAIMKFDEEVN